jgi:regulator of sigma E protease
LLPIPILDGGHLMFYAYEAVRGKPAGERLQQMGFQVGLALLMMLMVFVNFNDIMNVWRRLTGTG